MQNGPQYGDAISADRVKPEAINWTWPAEAALPEDHDDFRAGRIPEGMLTVVAGRPGEGKSMVTAFFAEQISNRKSGKNGVLFSNMEDPLAQVLRPRIEASGANLKNVHFFNFFIPKDQDGIVQQVEMLRTMIGALNIGLIIADPIAAHLGVSLYNDQEVRRALSPLTKMLGETGTAMIAVAHSNKHVGKNSHPLGAVGGSGGGLVGAARAVYIFGKDPADESIRVMAPAKFNVGPSLPSVAFDMEAEEWVLGTGRKASVIRTGKLVYLTDNHPADALSILSGSKGDDRGVPAEKKAIAAEWLTGYLAGGPQPATSIREDAADQGISWATLRRAADEVGVTKQRHGFGPGSHIQWDLPEGHPDRADATNVPDSDAPNADAEIGEMPDTLTVEDILGDTGDDTEES